MSRTDSSNSPFRDGFAAVWREPVLLPAELAWRWCFGFSALTLGFISIGLFLAGLRISAADEFLLRTLQPKLLDSALRHIFQGSLNRFLLEQMILLLGVMVLWSLAATAGRSATLRRLVAMFASEAEEETHTMRWDFLPILALQLLRVMWSSIALVVAVGCLSSGVIMARSERPLRAALALSFGIGLASVFGVVLNWYLGVAPLFCVRDGAGAMEAVDRAVGFSARHAGRLVLLGLGFFVLRLLWAGTMALALLSPLSLSGLIGGRWVAVLMGLVVLIYFAGADWLRLVRLAAYVSLAEDDSRLKRLEKAPDLLLPADAVPISGLA